MREEVLLRIRERRLRLSFDGMEVAEIIEAEAGDTLRYTALYGATARPISDTIELAREELGLKLERRPGRPATYEVEVLKEAGPLKNVCLPCGIWQSDMPACGHGKACYLSGRCAAALKHEERVGSKKWEDY